MLKRTVIAFLSAVVLVFAIPSEANAYTYFPTVMCQPLTTKPGTWMKISAWTNGYGGRTYHFSIRESEDMSGTGFHEVRFGYYWGAKFFGSSPSDSNPLEVYRNLNNHSYQFTATWTNYLGGIPVGGIWCTRTR